MSFDIDIGFASVAGKRSVNEDFALAWLPAGTERQERGSARPLPPPRSTPLFAGRGGWQLAFAVSLFVNLCLLLLVLIVGR